LGKKKCPFRGEHYRFGDVKGMHKKGRKHVISYTALNMEADTKGNPAVRGVKGSVDSNFKRRNGWFFLRVHDATDNQIQVMELFLKKQLGTEYNGAGSWFGFLACFLCPMGGAIYGDLSPVGVTDDEKKELIFAKMPKPHNSWFCSELVCAALVYGGVLTNPNINPATTTPNAICAYMRSKTGALSRTELYGSDGDSDNDE
jgi:hypothetical protein